MGSYYYLMAQLPYLIYEQKPPMSSESFKELARSLLNKADSVYLDFLTLNPAKANENPTGCSFIDNWHEWDKALRLNLAKERAIKLKREGEIISPPLFPLEASAAASKAVDEHSPLDGETVIDKARWNAIDNLAGNDYFHRNTVYAYYLKLLLIERREAFNVEKGFDEYKSLYASILDSAQKNSLGEPK